MENVRCQDGAPEALLDNYRALITSVSIISRHLPRPAKQVLLGTGADEQKTGAFL